jgi:predicted transcriptional regulator
MTYAASITKIFFGWAKDNGLSSQDIADELGASRVVVSNWRSKLIPRIHHYAIKAYMEKKKRENKGRNAPYLKRLAALDNKSAIKTVSKFTEPY